MSSASQAPSAGQAPSFEPIFAITRLVCWLSWFFSLSHIIRFRKKSIEEYPLGIGLYILLWFCALAVIVAIAPISCGWGILWLVVAFYRLQDLVFASLDDALKMTDRFKPAGAGDLPGQSPVLIAVLNVAQIVLIFAIAYLIIPVYPSFSPAEPSGRFGHLVLGWRSLPPLGSGYVPSTISTRVLTMIESGSAAIMITIALARFLRRD